MDPSHRDRLAFARICSGRFERGMTVTCDRTGRELTTKYATTAFGADRETVEEAFPGDVVGLVNATGLQLGDTIYAAGPTASRSRSRRSPASRPRCSPPPGRSTPAGPSSSAAASSSSTRKASCRCCATPTSATPTPCSPPSAPLQFEVFGHRLASEFNAPAEILSAGYQAIRRTDPASAPRLREIGGIRILNRSDGALVALFENRYRLARLEADEPELQLEPLVAGAIPAF